MKSNSVKKVPKANDYDGSINSTHRCCAERRWVSGDATCVYAKMKLGLVAVSWLVTSRIKLHDRAWSHTIACGPSLICLPTTYRRLLESWIADARRHGVPAFRVVSWVRRKLGSHMTIYRRRKDGSLGCATPCLFCSRELARFDIRVHCTLEGGGWFSGRVTDDGAPAAVLTSGQRRMIKGKGSQANK